MARRTVIAVPSCHPRRPAVKKDRPPAEDRNYVQHVNWAFASALASRLNAITPDTMRVRSDGANVVLLVNERQVGGSAAAAILDDDDGREFAERARTAVEAVLNGIQDTVIEELKGGWPPVRPGADLPLPGSRAVGGVVLGWYGDEDTPVVRLSAIQLSDLIE